MATRVHVQDEGSVRGDEAGEATVTVGVVAVKIVSIGARSHIMRMRELTQ